MSAAHHFELVTDWRIDAPIDAVYDALFDTASWPTWWHYVRSVETLRAGDAHGVGAMKRFTWDSRLPYSLRFDMEVVEARRPTRLRGIATGELEGEGLWELWPDDDGTRVRYTWRVGLNRPWMRTLAPVMAPAMRWNHNGLMAAGQAGLQSYLRSVLQNLRQKVLRPG
jgi:uncharacterized protein YndB with AHSA1/START domain